MMPKHLFEKIHEPGGRDPFLQQLKINAPCELIADNAVMLSRRPLTVALGVTPRGAHVLPRNAVIDTFASS